MNEFLIRQVQSNRKDPHFWVFKPGLKLLRAAPPRLMLSIKPANILETPEEAP